MRLSSYEVPVISRTLGFEERVTVNPRVSLMDLTLEALCGLHNFLVQNIENVLN